MATPPSNCPTCGARVEGAQGEQAYVYTCRFCGTHVSIPPLVKARDPRADLARAAMEMRVERARAAKDAAPARARARRSGCLVALLALLVPIGVIVGPWVVRQLTSTYASSAYAPFPIDVGLNESLEIHDREATGDGPLITVGVNGKLTLRRCHLKGGQIIRAGINSEVTIIDSVIEGSRGIVEGAQVNLVLSIQNSTVTSGEEIADGMSNAHVTVTAGSKVTSAAVAFPFDNNSTVSVDHSELTGKMGAIAVKEVGTVKLTGGAVVKSDGPAIDLQDNGHLTIASSQVESKAVALRASANFEGTLQGATLAGGRAAYDLGTNAHLAVSGSKFEGARKAGPSSTIDDR